MTAMEACSITRLRREDCNRTKHDSHFSKWQILIGPSDWEDYASGKEGAAKYRIHNLPKSSGPGLYELGIAVSHSSLGRQVSKLDPSRIIVVYLGQANNVRTRLQVYGQSGAHLVKTQSDGNVNSKVIDFIPAASGLFQDVFSRGYPIVFRWAPMESKSDAVKTEARLLNRFDYAWNKESNSSRRPNDIHRKLDKVASRNIWLPSIANLFQKRVGIRIKGTRPHLIGECNFNVNNGNDNGIFSGVIKIRKSRPRLVPERSDDDRRPIKVNVSPTCGVISSNGTPCRQLPNPGRKRCEEHKGQRIRPISTAPLDGKSSSHATERKVINQTGNLHMKASTQSQLDCGNVCGVELDDGSLCSTQPVAGRKRCEKHKGMRVKRNNILLVARKNVQPR